MAFTPSVQDAARVPYVQDLDVDDVAATFAGEALLAKTGLIQGEEVGLEALAFCLLLTGTFRGAWSVEAVLCIGLRAIIKYGSYEVLKKVKI
jgi:hypothetical protein